jgi:hypothetical protein
MINYYNAYDTLNFKIIRILYKMMIRLYWKVKKKLL